MHQARRLLIVKLAGIFGWFTAQAQSQTKGRTLSLAGEVLDQMNAPINGVLVTAYRTGKKVDEQPTKGGRYELKFDAGNPIDTVRYQHTAYNTGVVDDLCGQRPQTINKTLYLRGTKLGVLEGQEALSALERLFYVASLKDADLILVRLRVEIRPILTEMQEKRLLPDQLTARLTVVRRLYEQG